jgi:putative membrane-bound dehydrogenase-like protein
MVNNLTWGLDHKIYSSAALNGGLIRPADQPDAPGVSIKRRDFRFDPGTGAFESITGAVQFGNTFDDWGNRFLCSESHPLLQPLLPEHYLARNPSLAVPSAIHDIAGGAVPIFRISPVERWRQVRSSCRVAHGERSAESAGASHHVVDAGAGVTVYRGSAYLPEYYGNVFVGDAQNNLVHHRMLVPFGVTLRAERAPHERNTEFVRSSDNWFRPVNFVNAPDGTLYVLDMSREILEAIHIPLDVVKHLDLRSGRNQGRIYRIAPPGFRFSPPPKLSQFPTSELVLTLKRRDAWYRDTAQRLLYERQDQAAVTGLRRLLVEAQAPEPQTRVDALWTLRGLGGLRNEDLLLALVDRAAEVRAQALVLAESRLDGSPDLCERALQLAHDPDVKVRFQTAFSLGATRDSRAVAALAQIVRSDGADPWMRTAVLSSCGASADQFFAELAGETRRAAFAGGEEARVEVLDQLAQVVGSRGRENEIARVLDSLAAATVVKEPSFRRLRDRLVLGLGAGLRRSGRRLPLAQRPVGPGATMLTRLMSEAGATARNDHASEEERKEAIRLLGFAPAHVSRSILVELLDAHQPQEIQISALTALGEESERSVADLLIEHLPGFTPRIQAAAIEVLLSRDSWTPLLLEATCGGKVTAPSLGLIEPVRRASLLKHRNPEVASLARKLFQDGQSRSRAQVVSDHMSVLGLKGLTDRGRQVFIRECKACHKIGEIGVAIGPDLTGSPSRDGAALLSNILDPNAYALPGYIQYVVSDLNGRSYTGIIAAETGPSVTLRRGDGLQDTLLRNQIDAMSSTGQSLMPEGLEKTITKQEMADLVAFLRASHRGDADEEASDNAQPPRLDIGTLPGLIEPDD